MGSVTRLPEEYPPQASLSKEVYRPFPTLPTNFPIDPASIDAAALVQTGLTSLHDALQANDLAAVKSCFLGSQAYWRDLVALTWHIRTFNDGPAIAPALLQLQRERAWTGELNLDVASVKHVVVTPALQWVEGMFSFETGSPAAACGGRVILFPEEKEEDAGGEEGRIVWKIWTMSTWIDALKSFPEALDALKAPGRNLEGNEVIETDVFILGGGNGGLILAARLKALGVDTVVVDKNPQPGDNWALRYDCLRFHIGRHNCETPYLPYPDHLPVILTRQDLANHMKNYAAAFHLPIFNSSVVEGCSLNQARGIWTFKVRTPQGVRTVKSKHLVQATGVFGVAPYVPELPGEYQGVVVHSAQYKNPKTLTDRGAKSVIIVGSANSAFDVMEDCAAAGLQTTMIARSPTYIFPWEYSLAPQGLGLYATLPAERVDKMQMSGPTSISGQLARGLQVALAHREPDRYKPLAEAGFPVFDGVTGDGDLMHYLLERGGGHFNDIGEGIDMIVSGKVAVRGNVSPVAYSSTGLVLSDGSKLDADAIVWCTGFKDTDRSVTAQTLGGKLFVDEEEGKEEAGRVTGENESEVLGPQDVAARRDAIWGVDKEGELRGVFKRNLRMENYWIFGGTTAMHRYYSWPLALQIKAAVEGILPEAYRDTPKAD
ncbi:hypothetical protein M406DRAFT_71282 [Cryphonectria parasitica EP155]|uniref:FAD/NAD(P)-binding domain-containing protein n=1 Tax=Cryphonectria parasitica (strain ATCC 38755 / EP155) TaxID=660469 RepID=A0A9P4Y0I6_CRYP1|nr:uncharacterized protein M406DRAFT_71282 [Cryphonectria parasitica EP155]KAF3764155.1 hypothetical protein M406DRAFT_71282 [Cryphonectria parasitica EP155]